jgi:hypothetical protein
VLHLHRWLLAISVKLLLLSEENVQGGYLDVGLLIYETAC